MKLFIAICLAKWGSSKNFIYCFSLDKNSGFHKIARRKVKRSLIPNRTSIHERPQHINTRDEFAHWEGDLICFSHNKKANIFTMRERKSRYLVALKNTNRNPSTINLLMLHMMPGKLQIKIY